MIGLFGISIVFSVLLCIHCVRTGQDMYWLWIILGLQPIGGVVYLLAIVLPGVVKGGTVRNIEKSAIATLDPTRGYRQASAAHEDAPTVANKMKLAAAAMALERFEEAERLYAEAAQGIHAEDPALLLGRANALIELGRYADALPPMDKLGENEDKGRTPNAALALGRIYEGLGSTAEADSAYQWASQRLPGLEALARYTAFMARRERREEAAEALEEMDKRIIKLRGPFKKEAKHWRDLASQAFT